MDYNLFYNFVVEEEVRLRREMAADGYWGDESAVNYQLCKALAACYELQEHVAGRLAQKSVDKRDI